MERGGELFDDLRAYIERHGIGVVLRSMEIEKPGEFDGLTITINPNHDRESASYYLAHAFGSIVQWSTDFNRAQEVFDELRDAKRARGEDPARFDRALARYQRFEELSSEHAVWALVDSGHPQAVRSYTIFFRGDIEAMTIFHRSGKAPRWPEFYAAWKDRVDCGAIRLEPFTPRPFSPFQPVRIEKQEVLQER